MWTEIKTEKNFTEAKRWKELFEAEGIPTRILPAAGGAQGKEAAAYRVLVPEDKKHVIEDILRKL